MSAHLRLADFGIEQQEAAYQVALAIATARGQTPIEITVEDAEVAIEQIRATSSMARVPPSQGEG